MPDPAPDWLLADAGHEIDLVRFYAGAGLAALHPLVLARFAAVPLAVLVDRQAMTAGVSTLRIVRRREGMAALRDALLLRRADETLGPAGTIGQTWRQVTRASVKGQGGGIIPIGGNDPIARAAAALQGELKNSRDPLSALIAAERALASALHWPRLLPVITPGLTRADLTTDTPALEAAIARAIASQTPRILQAARDLARRAERLRALAPRLRSRGAEAALGLFLMEDAVAPTLALSPVVRGTAVCMSDRAARRLCERLVTLGGLRELSGRASFRIYGL